MAFKLAELFTEITVRDKKFNQSLDGVHGKLDRMTGSLKSVALVAGVAFAAAGAAAVKFLKDASDAEETASMFSAVFKDQEQAAQKFAETLSQNTGRSIIDIKRNMAGLQDTFVPLGFARDEARGLSQQMAALAIDLASFKNVAGGAEEVSSQITSALVGNHEAVRSYGVILTAANVQQKAFAMTGKTTATELTNQDKVLARLKLILEGTTDAQGDAVRTGDSLANQYRRLEASTKDLSVSMGYALMPAAKDLVAIMHRDIVPLMQDFFKEGSAGAEAMRSLASAMVSVVRAGRDLASSKVGRAVLAVVEGTAVAAQGVAADISGDPVAKAQADRSRMLYFGQLKEGSQQDKIFLRAIEDLRQSSKSTAKNTRDTSAFK